MSMPYWMLFAGLTLIAMMLIGTLLARLPLSGAMIYLALGFVLGPAGVGILRPDPWRNAGMLQLSAEAALLISLFAVGLKLEVLLLDRRWIAPLGLAFVSRSRRQDMALVGRRLALVDNRRHADRRDET